jgi:hypothetical protein
MAYRVATVNIGRSMVCRYATGGRPSVFAFASLPTENRLVGEDGMMKIICVFYKSTCYRNAVIGESIGRRWNERLENHTQSWHTG